jgi:hypothetical protein
MLGVAARVAVGVAGGGGGGATFAIFLLLHAAKNNMPVKAIMEAKGLKL